MHHVWVLHRVEQYLVPFLLLGSDLRKLPLLSVEKQLLCMHCLWAVPLLCSVCQFSGVFW